MKNFKTAKQALQEMFGYSQFRGMQEKVVSAICSGQDVVALMPTGAGKSLCFQVPGLVLGGTTIVLSPLIALMQDQVQALIKKGTSAAALTSHLSREEHEKILEQFKAGLLQFLYISPEKAAQESFQNCCKKVDIRLVAVDEAHCICEWGYDFRPEYKKIALFLSKLHSRPVCAAFTATATPATTQSIAQYLQLRSPTFLSSPSLRENILWHFVPVSKYSNIIVALSALISRFGHSSIIIYAATRVSVDALSELFSRLFPKHSILSYHAGMTTDKRSAVLKEFLLPSPSCLIATNAFGMGIDKPDVRCVIHAQFPSSIEQWYQEVGRAGRDGQLSFSFTLCLASDLQLQAQRAIKTPATKERRTQQLSQLLTVANTSECKTKLVSEYFGVKDISNDCYSCQHCCCGPQNFQQLINWCAPKVYAQQKRLHLELEWQQQHPTQALVESLTTQHDISSSYRYNSPP